MNCLRAFTLKKATCYLGIILLSSICHSQQKDIDSLEKLIANYKELDENYVRLRQSYATRKMFLTPLDTTWLAYNQETLEIAKKINYHEGLVLGYTNLGIVYQYLLSNPYKAIDNYLKCVELANKHNDLAPYLVSSLHNIGIIYYNQQEYGKALTYLNQALNTFNTHKHNKNISFKHYSTILVNLGNVYASLNKLDSAIHYYEKIIIEAEKANNEVHADNAHSSLGFMLNKKDKIEETLEHTEKSLRLLEKHKLEFVRSPDYLNAAELYLKNTDTIKTESFANKIFSLNKSLNNLETEKGIWETFTNIYEAQSDFPNALTAYKKFTVLKDSITSKDRKLEDYRKKIQFEADKKELLAQEEITRQKLIRNVLILGLVVFVICAIFGFIFYKRRKEAQFNLKVAATELKALRAQINPHFIYNTLNAIKAYISNHNVDEASNFLIKFSKLMRLEHSQFEEISLEDDISILKNYLDIERKRFDDKFKYTIEIDDNLNPENLLVPPMIMQPFVENSIWHGISKMEKDGIITITIKKEGDMIIYTIDDNGEGRNKSKTIEGLKKKSLGIKITRDRLEILNKKKKSNANVKIIDKAIGTKVEIQLPLELAY
jgi:tetratricopeptide (TPR) repeat protein/two-component sensor histidine kinase